MVREVYSAAMDHDFGGTFPFEARFTQTGDCELHYVDEGPPTPRRCCSSTATRPGATCGVARWPPSPARAIAAWPSTMGFGRSSKPPRLSAYCSSASEANAALIDALDLRDVTLVAHDWGGPIGLGALLERPRAPRAPGVDEHLGLGAAQLPAALPARVPQRGASEILALGGNLLVESIPGGAARRPPDPQMMEAYRAPFPDYWSRAGTLAFQREIPLTERDRSARLMASIHERLATLDVPVLLVWGMRDPSSSRSSFEQWRELFPDAQTYSSTTPRTTWWRTVPAR